MPSGTLPVTLLSFRGYKDGSRNQLRWTTTTELNNRGFEVQRSTDGINYSVIGFVNSIALFGNSSSDLDYTFTDNNPTLKMFDKLPAYRTPVVEVLCDKNCSTVNLSTSWQPCRTMPVYQRIL